MARTMQTAKAPSSRKPKPKSPDVKKSATKRQAGAKPKAAAASAAAVGSNGGKQAVAAAADNAVPPAAATAAAGEIDELFGKLKGKAKAKAAAPTAKPASSTAVKEAPKAKAKRLEGSKDDIFGTEAAAARNRTEEGYAIYSEAELGLCKAGGTTDKCPFDCDCCF